MSYSDILEGLQTRLRTISGVTVVTGEPTSVQVKALIYSVLDRVEREVQGTTVAVRYRTLHRACVRWVETETAEEELAALVNAVPMAIDASPHLGAKTRGQATTETGDAGWRTIGGIDYRCLDFFSNVYEVGPIGTL